MTTTQVGRRGVPVLVRRPEQAETRPAPNRPAPNRPARVRRTIATAAAGAVLTYFLVTSWPSLTASLTVLGHLSPGWLLPVVLTQAVSMAAPALVHHRLLRLRGTPVATRALLGITYASNAVSVTLPLAGPEVATAYTFRQLVRHGADIATAGWTLLISGVASAMTFALLTVGVAATTGNATATVASVATAIGVGTATAVLLWFLRRPAAGPRLERAAARVLSLPRRASTGSSPVAGFLHRLAEHRLGARDAAAVGILALTNWVADVACLAAALVAVGSPLPWAGLLLAFAAGTGVGALRLTPGGIGVVEAAMAAALVTSGVDAAHAVAAVLLYRLVSCWLVVAAGWVTFARGRQADGRATNPPDAQEARS